MHPDTKFNELELLRVAIHTKKLVLLCVFKPVLVASIK